VPTAAIAQAMAGERKAGTMTFAMIPPQLTPAVPMPARPAPISPPKSACDELDGRPSNQVTRFQRMPPTRPAKMIIMAVCGSSPRARSPESVWMLSTSLVMVAATSTERKAPTRFRIAESVTAAFGFSAPVAMDVAIAFPVSWNPFVKSKAIAVTITRIRMRSSPDMYSIVADASL
jgi:hypothetical protein